MTDDAKKPEIPTPEPIYIPRADFEMNTEHHDSSKIMLIATIVIMGVAIIGGVIAVTPKMKAADAEKLKVQQLQDQLAEMQRKQKDAAALNSSITDIQSKMQGFTDQAKELQTALSTGNMQSKIAALEGKINQVVQQSNSLGLSSMLAKVQAMQQSSEGSTTVSTIVAALAGAPQGQDVGTTLENMRAADPATAQLTEGVSPEDMKAAAMLMAMSQMRSSLQRDNDSFDEDLALLKRTLPTDDPKLTAAIDRLAPQAKYGVLTPSGLSQQLKGMTGDIVSASLSDQDVTLKEKAKARLSDVFLLEKNGQRVSGTETQIAIAAAQKELDMGNVQAAMDILQTLKGPAAQKTQPFMQQAEATVLAGNVQALLSQNIVQHLKAGVNSMVHPLPYGIVNPNGVTGITNGMKSLVPPDLAPMIPPQTVTPVH